MSAANQRMPAVFFGHGSPMNALERNRHTEAWAAFGRSIAAAEGDSRDLRALVRSRHRGDRDGEAADHSRLRRLSAALHAFNIPHRATPRSPRACAICWHRSRSRLDHEWGLDHGTWSVLAHVYPKADVPVVQLAIDRTQPAAFHYELGRRLAPLRDEGVMIVGSGNVVHNLGVIRWGGKRSAVSVGDAVQRTFRENLERREHAPLIDYAALGEAARMSIPTPEHYLPALYILGAQRDDDALSILTDGIELGSISMLSFAFGSHELAMTASPWSLRAAPCRTISALASSPRP